MPVSHWTATDGNRLQTVWTGEFSKSLEISRGPQCPHTSHRTSFVQVWKICWTNSLKIVRVLVDIWNVSQFRLCDSRAVFYRILWNLEPKYKTKTQKCSNIKITNLLNKDQNKRLMRQHRILTNENLKETRKDRHKWFPSTMHEWGTNKMAQYLKNTKRQRMTNAWATTMRIRWEWEVTGAELHEEKNTAEAETHLKQNTRIKETLNE